MSERDKARGGPPAPGSADDEFSDDGRTVADPDALARVLRNEAPRGFEAEKPTRVATSLEEAVVLRAEGDASFDVEIEEQRTNLRPTPWPAASAALRSAPGREFEQQAPTRMVRPPQGEGATEFDGGGETRFEGVPRDMEIVRPQLFSIDEAAASGWPRHRARLLRWALLLLGLVGIGVGVYLKAGDITALFGANPPR